MPLILPAPAPARRRRRGRGTGCVGSVRRIRVVPTTDGELADLLGSAHAVVSITESIAIDALTVFVTAPDGTTPDPATVARLASLPCIVVAAGRPPGDTPAIADVVEDADVASVDDVLTVIDATPIAATALALLLRG